MLISSVALLAFMFFVSFTVWPQAVLVVSFMAGVLVTLQYFLFGIHRIALGIRWVFKRTSAGLSRLFLRSNEAEPVGGEKDGVSPKPTINTHKDKVAGSGESENEKST